jgi:hypothetical protein
MRFSHPFPAWFHWRLPILVAALCCTSCSKSGYNSVRGKVLYKDEPIEGVVVTFHPKGKTKLPEPPIGITREDGTFEVMTGKDDGAPEGDYVVTFYCPQQKSEDKPGKKGRSKGMVMQKMELEDQFKGAYASEMKSNFRVTIKNGKNDLEPFKLK